VSITEQELIQRLRAVKAGAPTPNTPPPTDEETDILGRIKDIKSSSSAWQTQPDVGTVNTQQMKEYMAEQGHSDLRTPGEYALDKLAKLGEGETYPLRHPVDFVGGLLNSVAPPMYVPPRPGGGVLMPGFTNTPQPSLAEKAKATLKPAVTLGKLGLSSTGAFPRPPEADINEAVKQAGVMATTAGIGKLIDVGVGARNDSVAAKADSKSISNLSSVIQSGHKNITGREAAGVLQPHLQSFVLRSGVNPEAILPESGSVADLARGGTAKDLAAFNKTLLEQHVSMGRTPESFVPASSVQMALAQGAINEAHAPIANAINAVRTARVDGSMEGVPDIQQNIIMKLRGIKKNLEPSQLAEMGKNYDSAIADILSHGNTIGGLDFIRQKWNEGMSRFYNATPGNVSNADTSAAVVWKIGNEILRNELYPAVENMTNRGGAGADLAKAGQNEAVAINSMDGIFRGQIKESNLTDNVDTESYFKYVTEGPESLVGGIRNPKGTILGTVKRAVTPRQMPIGEFNRALRKGIGNMSDAVRMDASALANRDVTSNEPFGYPRTTGAARGAGTTGGLPGSLTPTPPAPAAQPPVYNTTGTPTVTSGSLPGSLTMQKEAVGSPLQPSGPAAASAGPSGQRAASLAPYGAPEQAAPATGITYEGTPNVTSGELPSSLTPTKPTPPTGIPTGKATVTSGELPQSLAPKPKEPVKQDYPEGRGPSKAPAAKKPAKSYMESLMEEFGLDVPHGGGVKAPTPPSKK
jgi:hypothetical protein